MTCAINLSKNSLIASEVEIADTFLKRMQGLLGRKELLPGTSLLITHCQSIHMFFMKFPIDVIFADKNNKVVGLVQNIKPCKMSRIFWKASYALECTAGTIIEKNTTIGDILELRS